MAKTRRSVESLKHKDKRKNIPTEELRDFVQDDELSPKTMLYPRDPSLDPQLVWKGKDEQDRTDLAVPVVPIYIQEKIHPHAIIEDFKNQAKKAQPQHQYSLFDDFNGIEFEQMIDFYQHEQNWSNRMILGDSLLVMTSLAEKEGLKGKVQMIFVDPPYGINFASNWQVSTRKRVVKDTRTEDVSRQPEQIRAFRDTWNLGMHSYLSYLRDRLMVARDLLAESGSILVQIGDENLHLIRSVMDEILGPENSHPVIAFRKKMMPMMKEPGFESVCDYIVWYQKNKRESHKLLNKIFMPKNVEGDGSWNWIELPDGGRRRMTAAENESHRLLPPKARVFQPISMLPREYRENQDFDFEYRGRTFAPPKKICWSTTLNGMKRLAMAGRLHESGNEGLRYVYYHEDYPVARIGATWMDTAPASDMRYVVETNTKVIERLILTCTNPGDLVLDPTCGGGTTAFVAEKWGRRWITVDTSRVALTLARTRLMSSLYPYYLLADSPDGIIKEVERSGTLPPAPPPKTYNNVRKGFCHRAAPHVTLGSIANNEKIDTIHAAWDAKLTPILNELTSVLNRSWEEWEVPREPDDTWTSKTKALLKSWWGNKTARQKAIDEAITKRADYEILYDQPYEDTKKVRVTGPFTVETLSPHRVLSIDQEMPGSEEEGKTQSTSGQFETMIIDYLRKSGVQNTFKNERLRFDRLEPYAGTWLHAEGEYSENGKTKRVAVSIGPEHGTVGPELVKEAAKEAVQGIGFDLLIVCGFWFDPHVTDSLLPIPDTGAMVRLSFCGWPRSWPSQLPWLPA